jgi:hypothetical protein
MLETDCVGMVFVVLNETGYGLLRLTFDHTPAPRPAGEQRPALHRALPNAVAQIAMALC